MIKKLLSNTIKNITLWNFKHFLKGNIVSNPNARIEVFTMLGHDFLWMYLVAIMSFKKNFGIDCKITIFDDGTLTEKDKKTLRQRINNVEIKEELYNLTSFPKIKYYREKLILIKKILCAKLCEKETLVQFDSDLIFVNKAPSKYINAFLSEEVVTFADIAEKPFYTNEIIPYQYFNSGFMKFKREDVDLNEVEKYLNIYPEPQGNELWLVEQTLFAHLFALKNRNHLVMPQSLFHSYIPIKKTLGIHFVKQNRFIDFTYLKAFWRFLNDKCINN